MEWWASTRARLLASSIPPGGDAPNRISGAIREVRKGLRDTESPAANAALDPQDGIIGALSRGGVATRARMPPAKIRSESRTGRKCEDPGPFQPG